MHAANSRAEGTPEIDEARSVLGEATEQECGHVTQKVCHGFGCGLMLS